MQLFLNPKNSYHQLVAIVTPGEQPLLLTYQFLQTLDMVRYGQDAIITQPQMWKPIMPGFNTTNQPNHLTKEITLYIQTQRQGILRSCYHTDSIVANTVLGPIVPDGWVWLSVCCCLMIVSPVWIDSGIHPTASLPIRWSYWCVCVVVVGSACRMYYNRKWVPGNKDS
jgi:hypothetical protein